MTTTDILVSIRHAVEADLPALEWDGEYRHYRRVFRDTWADVQKGRRAMLLALAADALVGQVFIQFSSTSALLADGTRRGYLYALRVKPDWRRRGIGRQLVLAAEAELRAHGYQVAVIAVAQTNAGARRLYEALGYRIYADDPGV
jgi:ribosomal protein S18 acetylase RimI-like enzyme